MIIFKNIYKKAQTLFLQLLHRVHNVVPRRVRQYLARTRLSMLVHKYWSKRIATAFIVILVFLSAGVIKSVITKSSQLLPQTNIRTVQLISIGEDQKYSSLLTATGIVRARAQGDLRMQVPGLVTSIRASVGQYVTAGTIIASVENATQQAGIAQAAAGVAQASAQLKKIEGGTRSEQLSVLKAITNTASARSNSARTNAENALLSAYSTTDTTFGGGVDSFFVTPRGANPQLIFYSTRSDARLQAQNKRLLLQSTIERQVVATKEVTLMNIDNIKDELVQTQKEMRAIKSELDAIITALDGGIASAAIPKSTLLSDKIMATTRRGQVLGVLSALGGALEGLTSAQNALVIAQQNEELGISGAQSEDKVSARALLDSAQATYALAVAQLEKTRVRAPVSGIIQTLSISKGDFVGAFQNVGLVASNDALEIQTYLSPQTANRIAIGGSVRIQNNTKGIITSIAPGTDASGQISVRIAVTTKGTRNVFSLTSGDRVNVTFSTDTTRNKKAKTNANLLIDTSKNLILIPITALKLNGNIASVFIVDDKNIIRAKEVTLGNVIQNSIEILSGITKVNLIVRDARGLSEGDIVIVGINKK